MLGKKTAGELAEQGPDGQARPFTRMSPGEPGLDQWHALIKPDAVGRWTLAPDRSQTRFRRRDVGTTNLGTGPEKR